MPLLKTLSNSQQRAFPALFRAFFENQLHDLYTKVKQKESGHILENLLDELQVKINVAPEDLVRIPKTGPVVVVCNHPFGILDGAMIRALLAKVRQDVKILANYLLAAMPELAPDCIFVDPFNSKSSPETNRKGLKQAITHLRNGGLLVIFPAGEVSHWQFRYAQVVDPKWNETTARLIRITQAITVPVLCTGRNSVPFQLLGLVHPMLRTTRLPNELLNKTGKQIEVRIGSPIPAEKINQIPDDAQATRYLRTSTYLLSARRGSQERHLSPLAFPALKKPAPVASETSKELIAEEIRCLNRQRNLVENGEFMVFAAQSPELRHTLREIGRLREITFREAGEGTGKDLDLDEFDSSYTHLVLWNKNRQEIAGAYRLGCTRDLLEGGQISKLYTSTLFNYDPVFFEQLGPAVELGRSFIRAEYQKQYTPLMMLWKGIVQFAVLRAEVPILFGAVSISGRYDWASRELMVKFFESQHHSLLANLVRPRRPFRSRPLRPWEVKAVSNLWGIDELSASIADIERDGKGVPILLRQYVRMGGTVLCFNIDRKFSNVLDALIMLDMRTADPARIKPYVSLEALNGLAQPRETELQPAS
ncbi:MAG TPA: lysophospholipid acyltransferase family protein [Candidatus Angelobacter sp.]|jgi:putative hemolysin|nr:lysophospholipid acyltransferase family protein [Candidatus Angelobacter sp.]